MSLKTLDLTKFYTPRAETMWDMFNGASSLVSLNLSSFNTSKVTDMESMFDGCSNIVSLNLSHFVTNRVYYMNKMFRYCYKLKYLYFRNISTNSIGTMEQMFYQCTSLIYIDLYNINYEPSSTSSMFTNTSGNFTYCINSYYSIPTIRSYLEKLNTTSNCLNFTFPLIEVFEEELSTTEIIEVFEDEPCTKEYPYKNSKNICVEKCSINDLEEGKCILNYTITINENKTEIDKEQDKLNNIKEELMNGYNTSGIDSGQDVVIKNEETGVTISITSTENQKNNEDKNNISMNLGECENILKREYNIPNNNS
jgi:surface protein